MRRPCPGIKEAAGARCGGPPKRSRAAERADDILAEEGTGASTALLTRAGLQADEIDALFLTGGSTRLAQLPAAINSALPNAKVIVGDTFGSVGAGLTNDAMRRFGRAV
jgi:hypothetical chaperone protein